MSRILMHNCLKFSLILFLLQFFQLDIVAQGSKTKKPLFPPNPEADAIVSRHASKYGGQLAVMATKDSQLVYQKNLGDFNVNTQVQVGAMSSWFTAALVMQFVDQGKIKLDDKVSKYLPIFKQYAKGYITIRNCLMNTTGIEAEKGGIEKFFQKTKFASLEEMVNSYASKHEIHNNPGLEYYYSNMGINIAARVVEIVGKKPFERLVMERILRPLGMKKTNFASEVAVDPAFGATSSASDYIRFLTMLINKGTLNGKQVLSEKAVDELLKVREPGVSKLYTPAFVSGMEPTFGSWAETNGDAQPKIFISPGFFGSYAYLDLNKKLAVVIMTNKTKKEDKSEILEIVEVL